MKTKIQSLRADQRGMASIIITMVLIIIMTLVVLAMSQNANREQRQALDRQLSDQAFYNAESGINEWTNWLYENRSNSAIPIEKTECENTGALSAAPGPEVDGPEGVNSYSCVLYDKAPPSVEFDDMTISDSNVVQLLPLGNGNLIRHLTFEWTEPNGNGVVNGCNYTGATLPQSLATNCNVGGIRIELVDPSGGNRDQIRNNNFVAYILPRVNNGGDINYAVGDKGLIGQGNCSSTTGRCTLRVSLTGQPKRTLFLHIKSLYSGNDVTVTGCSNADRNSCGQGNGAVEFLDAQWMIDATGKSNDVLRRVQVRVPAQASYDTPGGFSLKTTQTICKLITVNDTAQTATRSTRCPD